MSTPCLQLPNLEKRLSQISPRVRLEPDLEAPLSLPRSTLYFWLAEVLCINYKLTAA